MRLKSLGLFGGWMLLNPSITLPTLHLTIVFKAFFNLPGHQQSPPGWGGHPTWVVGQGEIFVVWCRLVDGIFRIH